MLDEDAAKLLDQQSPIRKNCKYRKSGRRDHRHKGKQLTAAELVEVSKMPPTAMAIVVEQVDFFTLQKPVNGKGMPDWRIFQLTVLTNALEKQWECLMKKAYNPNKITILASNELPSTNGFRS